MKLLHFIADETAAQKIHIFLWAPVFLAIGIGVYFALMFEPPFWPSLSFLFLTSCLLFLTRQYPGRNALVLLMFLACLGFAAAQIRANILYTPILEREIGPVRVTATIEAVEELEEGKGQRLLLVRPVIEKVPPEKTPIKIRLTKRKEDDFSPGQRVTLLVNLNPPSPPVAPGAFDFQRYMYFQQIGAVGFIYKTIEIFPLTTKTPRLQEDCDKPLVSWCLGGFNFYLIPAFAGMTMDGYWESIETLRNTIASRIRSVIEPSTAPMSVAFVTGHRAAISEDDNQAMRDSGLAHLISISGIHIGLFSAFIFFIARFLMACVPGMAIRHPIKKYAAVLGFMGAAFYTVLAGGSVPTIRSLIMTALVYAAIMLDRSPISLRLLAASAFVLLLMAPESLVSASFQMSFAAMTALIVVFDGLRSRWSSWYAQAGVLREFLLYLLGVCATTIIASAATAPFSLFHFQQFAIYSLLANVLAAPVTSFIIMPAIVISLFAMPFGLDWLPLKALEIGMSAILWIAHWVATLPHAALYVAAWPMAALIFTVCGMLFFALWQGRMRWMGAIPVLIGAFFIYTARMPDVLISDDFKLMAYQSDDGFLHSSSLNKNKFARENWERLMGLPKNSSQAWPKEGREGNIVCDAWACRLDLKGNRISFVKKPSAAQDECAWAGLVVAFDKLPEGVCGNLADSLDKYNGYDSGSHAVYADKNGIRIETARDYRGDRLWSE
jgi:competence protein ComEC